MDYKYIEQLLERYWECETSLEEEAILRNFFSQKEVPAHLQAYRDVFFAEVELSQAGLSEDFDARVLSQIDVEEEQPMVHVVPFSFSHRLRPLYKATAVVAILLTLGMAMQQGFHNSHQADQGLALQPTADTAATFTEMPEIVDQASASLSTSGRDTLSGTILQEVPEEVAN